MSGEWMKRWRVIFPINVQTCHYLSHLNPIYSVERFLKIDKADIHFIPTVNSTMHLTSSLCNLAIRQHLNRTVYSLYFRVTEWIMRFFCVFILSYVYCLSRILSAFLRWCDAYRFWAILGWHISASSLFLLQFATLLSENRVLWLRDLLPLAHTKRHWGRCNTILTLHFHFLTVTLLEMYAHCVLPCCWVKMGYWTSSSFDYVHWYSAY